MIRIFEVGPRDGLQNEPTILSLEDKLWLLESLSSAGVTQIEAGALVRPDKVPQMADTEAVQEKLLQGDQGKNSPTAYWYLVPNKKGLERALAKKVKNIALFTAVSETFNQKNIGMSVDESFAGISEMIEIAKIEGLQVRGYVSTVWGCPFEGRISPKQALPILERMLALGVDQLSIGDTIGVANPNAVAEVLSPLIQNHSSVADEKLAVHFHDTRGTALVNSWKAYELGIRTFDSSIGGLGGCPFAPGAAGNVATEDLLYLFKEMGVVTGVNYSEFCRIGMELSRKMKKNFTSKALQAFIANCTKNNEWDS